MTAQFADSIVIDGKAFALFAEPLAGLLVQRNLFFVPQSSACWRGYVAGWEASDGRLFLVNISGVMSSATSDSQLLYCTGCGAAVQANSEPCPLCGANQFSCEAPANLSRGPRPHDGPRVLQTVELEDLFPGSAGRVFADWVTGTFRVPQGNMIEYVHMGYESRYESYLLLQIDHGMVIAVTTEEGGGQSWWKGGRTTLRRALAAIPLMVLILPLLYVWCDAMNQALAQWVGTQLYPPFPVLVIGVQALVVMAMLWASWRLAPRVVSAGLIALCVAACYSGTL